MGYTLIPSKKSIEKIGFGAFSWPAILQQTGAGYVIGYGAGRMPSQYVYVPRNNGASPVSNDGFRVKSSEAKMMAKIIRGYISVNRFINKDWEEAYDNDVDREYAKNYKVEGEPLYTIGVHENRLKELEKFCDFAENSGGFKIY